MSNSPKNSAKFMEFKLSDTHVCFNLFYGNIKFNIRRKSKVKKKSKKKSWQILLCEKMPECNLKRKIKNSIFKKQNKINNNKFILIKDGKTILNPIIKGLEVEFIGQNGTVIIHYPIKKIENLKIICGQNAKVEIFESKKYYKNTVLSAAAENTSITIGKNTSMNNGCELVCDKEPNLSIQIGEECMLAPNVLMRTSDGHCIYSAVTNERLNEGKDIKIGNHVWLLTSVSVNKGVTLGNNIIVTAKSVVTKSFEEENTMIGGLPAKKIKDNVIWTREI